MIRSNLVLKKIALSAAPNNENFFKTKLDPITDIRLDNEIVAVFELYLSELLKNHLRQLRHEAIPRAIFACNQKHLIFN